MKKVLLLSTLALSAHAFAADVDYSRCWTASGLYNATIDNDGKLQPTAGSTITNVKTDGKKETYTIETQGYMSGKSQSVVQIERDDQGRVIKTQMGGDSVDPAQVTQFKNQSLTYSSGTAGVNEPSVYVTKDNKFTVVPVSQLSKDQAKELGYTGDWEEIKRLKSQWKKDKKSVDKIRESYAALMSKAPVIMPLGKSAEFDFKDGSCVTKKSGDRFYNTKTKEINTAENISREQCEAAKTAFLKHQKKIAECGISDMNIAQDLYANHSKIFGNSAYGMGLNQAPSQGIMDGYKMSMSGYVGGSGVGITGGGYIGGGMGGYMTGGMMGGYGMGMGVGMYGMGMGGSGTGMMLSNLNMQCEMLYGTGSYPYGGGVMTGGSVGGAIGQ